MEGSRQRWVTAAAAAMSAIMSMLVPTTRSPQDSAENGPSSTRETTRDVNSRVRFPFRVGKQSPIFTRPAFVQSLCAHSNGRVGYCSAHETTDRRRAHRGTSVSRARATGDRERLGVDR